MPAAVYYTADMVRGLPDDGNRYETVRGELLVTPAPRLLHQEIIKRLVVTLDAYLGQDPVGHVLASPADISWGPDTLVQPDVFVVPLAEARTMSWEFLKTLLLAIEVLSPSSTRADRFTKRRLYQEIGVPVYWIVDADAQAVEVWTPDVAFPIVERERVSWRPTGTDAALSIDLADLFRPI